MVKNLPVSAGDRGSIPGPGRSHCQGTTKPECRNCWRLCAPEPELPNKRSPRWRPPRREALTRGAPAARGPRATARRARRESSPSSKEPAQPKQNHTQKHKRIACGTFQLLLSSLVCLLDDHGKEETDSVFKEAVSCTLRT